MVRSLVGLTLIVLGAGVEYVETAAKLLDLEDQIFSDRPLVFDLGPEIQHAAPGLGESGGGLKQGTRYLV